MEQYHGFTVEKRDDIYIYRFREVDRKAVDDWYQVDAEQTRLASQTTNHALRVYVFERPFFPTPYLSNKADQALKETPPELYESAAVIISNPVLFQAINFFLNRIFSSRQRSEIRTFRDLETAIKWIEAQRKKVAAQMAQNSE